MMVSCPLECQRYLGDLVIIAGKCKRRCRRHWNHGRDFCCVSNAPLRIDTIESPESGLLGAGVSIGGMAWTRKRQGARVMDTKPSGCSGLCGNRVSIGKFGTAMGKFRAELQNDPVNIHMPVMHPSHGCPMGRHAPPVDLQGHGKSQCPATQISCK